MYNLYKYIAVHKNNNKKSLQYRAFTQNRVTHFGIVTTLVQGVPRLSPKVSWDRPQLTHDPSVE